MAIFRVPCQKHVIFPAFKFEIKILVKWRFSMCLVRNRLLGSIIVSHRVHFKISHILVYCSCHVVELVIARCHRHTRTSCWCLGVSTLTHTLARYRSDDELPRCSIFLVTRSFISSASFNVHTYTTTSNGWVYSHCRHLIQFIIQNEYSRNSLLWIGYWRTIVITFTYIHLLHSLFIQVHSVAVHTFQWFRHFGQFTYFSHYTSLTLIPLTKLKHC
jgi:hypothetical protein